MHQKADSIKLVNKYFYPECYYKAEDYMIERSDTLWIFGSPKNHVHAVKTAKKKGIPANFF